MRESEREISFSLFKSRVFLCLGPPAVGSRRRLGLLLAAPVPPHPEERMRGCSGGSPGRTGVSSVPFYTALFLPYKRVFNRLKIQIKKWLLRLIGFPLENYRYGRTIERTKSILDFV